MKAKDILTDICRHFNNTRGTLEKTALNKRVIHLECDHGKAQNIGQYAVRQFPKQIHTYFACHIFRKARLSIYFKR